MTTRIEVDKERQAEHWNEEAASYDRWYETERGRAFVEAEARAVLRALTPNPACDVLELGCGTGRVTERLAPQVNSIAACDLSEKSLEVVQSKASRLPARITTHHLDAAKPLPFKDSTFDRVLSVQMLQHVDATQHRAVIQEIRRVLKPGGIAVITAYRFGRWIRGEKIEYAEGLYRYAFDAAELKDHFTACGFSKTQMRGVINLPAKLFALTKRLPFLSPLVTATDLNLGLLPQSAHWGVYLLARAR